MKNFSKMRSHIFSLGIFSLVCIGTLSAKEYQVVFYSDFEPISYATDRDINSEKFNEANGYEVDLLKAIEAIDESGMTFNFKGEKIWNNLWLQPYLNPEIDIAMGGITREKKRTLDMQGKQVVATTHKTLSFKQSLLINAKDANLVKTHQDLTSAFVVGAVKGTTGEYRFLAQTHMIDNLKNGFLKEGITVILDDRSYIESDGNLSIYDINLQNRSKLLSSDNTMPNVIYFEAEDSMIPALQEGHIDAIARGFIGNQLVAERSEDQLIVTGVYSLECPDKASTSCENKEEAVMFVKWQDETLLSKLNQYIDYLTDQGRIDYDDWKQSPNIFFERAQQLNLTNIA